MSAKDCPRGCGQSYDQDVNDGDRCYACVGNSLVIDGAESLRHLPPHDVTEEGINVVGQSYYRLRYVDGSECLVEDMTR